MPLSNEQIVAGVQIVQSFEKVRWTMMIAQMQSGKTCAFLFVAAEMLRQKKIKKVILICGCNETELKAQMIKSIEKFVETYRAYLMEAHATIPEHERNSIIRGIFAEGTFVVKSGTSLESKHASPELVEALIIWDESHFAAAQSNRPNKFLERAGIKADGSGEFLEAKNNFVLSVSATPYAELTDLQTEKQEKIIVKLNPGAGYKGVGHLLKNKNIVGFKKWQNGLKDALVKCDRMKNQYAIVRVTGGKMEEAVRIANSCGWEYKTFDSVTSDIESMDELEFAPTENTVVFIRGMCRMGKVVPKQNMAFVMETGTGIKTDTLLQGLLGRMCGYGIDRDIFVVIHDNLLTKKSGANITVCGQKVSVCEKSELEKFVALMEQDDRFSPTTTETVCIADKKKEIFVPVEVSLIPGGAHIKRPSDKPPVYDMHPFVVNLDVDKTDGDSPETFMERLRKIDLNDLGVVNKNGALHTAEAQFQLLNAVIKIHKPGAKTYDGVPESFNKMISTGEKLNAVRSKPGCGFECSTSAQINAWVFETNKYAHLGFPSGTVILQAISNVPAAGVFIQTTTGKEAFTRKREDKSESIGNGVFQIKLGVDTSESVERMQAAIEIIVKTSLDLHSDANDRRITSVHSSAGWQSIMVNDEVKIAISKGGLIYKYLQEKYGVTLKITGRKGRPTTACKDSGLNLLCAISW